MKFANYLGVVLVAVVFIQLSAGSCFAQKFTDVSGHGTCLALREDGTVWQWGYYQKVPSQISINGVKAISAGAGFGVALKEDGSVWVWGNDDWGQYGDGTIDELAYSPIPVKAHISNVKTIAAGSNMVLVLKEDGTVWAWGCDSYNQLGDGRASAMYQKVYSTTPVQIAGLLNVTDITTSGDNCVVRLDDGSYWGWGSNMIETGGTNITGLLESSDRWSIPGPVRLNITDAKKVITDGSTLVYLKNDGTVWGWGVDTNNRLGDFTTYLGTDVYRFSPVKADIDHVTDISTSINTIALKDDGTVWTWGDNSAGSLGTGNRYDFQVKPVKAYISDVIKVSGGRSALALKKDGTVWAWGDNYAGQVGNGKTDVVLSPVMVLSTDEQPVVALSGKVPPTPTQSPTVLPANTTLVSPTVSATEANSPTNTTSTGKAAGSIVDLRVAGIVLFILLLAGGIYWVRKKTR